MNRISIFLLGVFVCLSMISCNKEDSLKTIYAHYEFILDDKETVSGDIGVYEDFILDRKYPIQCDVYFSRDTSGNPIFDCAISRVKGGASAYLAVSNSDSQIFIDGKDYYTDKGEKELMEETDHKHFLSSIYFKERYFSFFEQARYRFDLVEQDGICYTFSFEFIYSPEYSLYRPDDKLPHNLKGQIDVYNTYPGRKGYDSFIKKEKKIE